MTSTQQITEQKEPIKAISEYPLPKVLPVSGRWRAEGKARPYIVVELEDLAPKHIRISISRVYSLG
jgi:hypothetical protein